MADCPFGGPEASSLMLSLVVVRGLTAGEVMLEPPQPKLYDELPDNRPAGDSACAVMLCRPGVFLLNVTVVLATAGSLEGVILIWPAAPPVKFVATGLPSTVSRM